MIRPDTCGEWFSTEYHTTLGYFSNSLTSGGQRYVFIGVGKIATENMRILTSTGIWVEHNAKLQNLNKRILSVCEELKKRLKRDTTPPQKRIKVEPF
jgi:hypothetical protein